MRTYNQFCGIAQALDLLGQRWTLLILRELLPGPRRYSELQRSLKGITTNLLADRTKQLQEAGLLKRVRRESDGRRAWGLTDLGEATRPVLMALGAFGARWMTDVGEREAHGRWFAISLQRRYRGGVETSQIGLEIDGERYAVFVNPMQLVSRDGWPEDPDLILRGSLRDVARALARDGELVPGAELQGSTDLFEALRIGLAAEADQLEFPADQRRY